MRSVSSIVVTLASAVLLSAGTCSAGSTAPVTDLTAARARWLRSGPRNYSYVIRRSCKCVPASSGPVVVTVRDDVVESRRYAESGATVVPDYAELFPAVQGLFAIIDGAVRNGTSPLTVEYHPTLGYPTRIALGDPLADAPLYVVTDLRAK